MPRSQPPPEGLDSDVGSGSLRRLKALTKKLLAVDPDEFRRTLEKDKAERRGKRRV